MTARNDITGDVIRSAGGVDFKEAPPMAVEIPELEDALRTVLSPDSITEEYLARCVTAIKKTSPKKLKEFILARHGGQR